jgi:hypothetical protein
MILKIPLNPPLKKGEVGFLLPLEKGGGERFNFSAAKQLIRNLSP